MVKLISKQVEINTLEPKIRIDDVIRSYDLEDTQFEIKVLNEDLDLTDATIHCVVKYYLNGKSFAIEKLARPKSSDTVLFSLPEELKGFDGRLHIGLYADLGEERIDIKDIELNIENSIIDQNLDFTTVNYFESFEKVVEKVNATAQDAIESIENDVDHVESYRDKAREHIDEQVDSFEEYAKSSKDIVDSKLVMLINRMDSFEDKVEHANKDIDTEREKVLELSKSLNKDVEDFEQIKNTAKQTANNAVSDINAITDDFKAKKTEFSTVVNGITTNFDSKVKDLGRYTEERKLYIDEKTKSFNALVDEKTGELTQLNNTFNQELEKSGVTLTTAQDLNQRVIALESKPDNDTIYDDTEIRQSIANVDNKMSGLSAKVTALEERPIVDTALTERVVALERKEDKDTVYDDSELVKRLETLESRKQSGTIYRAYATDANGSDIYRGTTPYYNILSDDDGEKWSDILCYNKFIEKDSMHAVTNIPFENAYLHKQTRQLNEDYGKLLNEETGEWVSEYYKSVDIQSSKLSDGEQLTLILGNDLKMYMITDSEVGEFSKYEESIHFEGFKRQKTGYDTLKITVYNHEGLLSFKEPVAIDFETDIIDGFLPFNKKYKYVGISIDGENYTWESMERKIAFSNPYNTGARNFNLIETILNYGQGFNTSIIKHLDYHEVNISKEDGGEFSDVTLVIYKGYSFDSLISAIAQNQYGVSNLKKIERLSRREVIAKSKITYTKGNYEHAELWFPGANNVSFMLKFTFKNPVSSARICLRITDKNKFEFIQKDYPESLDILLNGANLLSVPNPFKYLNQLKEELNAANSLIETSNAKISELNTQLEEVVKNNQKRHAPTGYTLDRTEHPWVIRFDNGCELRFPDYADSPTVYGYGYYDNVYDNNMITFPLVVNIMRAANGSLTVDKVRTINGYADYWAETAEIANPINDKNIYDWTNARFNEEALAQNNYKYDRQRTFIRVLYELGIWDSKTVESFGAVKK